MDQFSGFSSVFSSKDQFTFAGLVDFHFRSAVKIAIRMTGQGDWLRPGLDIRFNAFNQDWGAKYGTIHNGTNGCIWAFPHFL